MKKLLLFALITLIVISGCILQGTASSKQEAESRASSVVAVTLPDFQLSPGDSVSWYADIVWVDPQQLLSNRPAVRDLLKDEILKRMADRKHVFVGSGAAEYEVFVAVILGSVTTEEKTRMNAFFKIDPILGTDSRHYEEGTLLMAIGKRDNSQALWRGAVKMFILGNDILDSTAQDRLKKYVDLMVSSIPKK